MGAEFRSWNGGECDSATLRKKFAEHQEDERDQNGNDIYSGHLGIVDGLNVTSRQFDTYEQAEDWLMDNAQKWESAEAVQYKGTVKKRTQSAQTASDRYERLNTEYNDFDKTVLKEVKSAKSKTIGCKHCGSNISRKYLTGLYCPVCHSANEFINDTRKNQKKRLGERVSEAREKFRNHNNKAKDTAGYLWLVGGTCPC